MMEAGIIFDIVALQQEYAESKRLMMTAVNVLGQRRRDMEEAGNALNLAESEYHNAKAIESLRMKADGMPVTLIQEAVRGQQDVAEKRLARDAAQTVYDRAKAAHFDARTAAGIYETANRQTYGLLTRAMDYERNGNGH